MRNVLRVLSVGLLLGMPAVAVAGPSATGYGATEAAGHSANWWWKPTPRPQPVPELSVGGAGAALAVLVGGALMMAERRRREHGK